MTEGKKLIDRISNARNKLKPEVQMELNRKDLENYVTEEVEKFRAKVLEELNEEWVRNMKWADGHIELSNMSEGKRFTCHAEGVQKSIEAVKETKIELT